MSGLVVVVLSWALAQGEELVGPPAPEPPAIEELAGPPEEEVGPPVGEEPKTEEPKTEEPKTEEPKAEPPGPTTEDREPRTEDRGPTAPPGFMELANTPAVEESAAGTEKAPEDEFTLRRSGLYRWGLGLELPMIGVLTGVGSRSRIGWGYTFGGALSWELTPKILLRLSTMYGETGGGESPIRFVQGNEQRRARQDAEWVGAELLVGGAYQFREPGRPWSLYAGGDVGATFSGFFFDLDDELQFLRATDAGDAINQCGTPTCRSTINDALGFAFTAVARGGVRWDFFPWLQGIGDLSLQWVNLGNETLSNTVAVRDVRTSPEATLLFRLTVGARLVL